MKYLRMKLEVLETAALTPLINKNVDLKLHRRHKLFCNYHSRIEVLETSPLKQLINKNVPEIPQQVQIISKISLNYFYKRKYYEGGIMNIGKASCNFRKRIEILVNKYLFSSQNNR